MPLGKLLAPLKKLKGALRKTRDILGSRFKQIFRLGRRVDRDLLDELEEAMITSDIGVSATMKILGQIKEAYENREVSDAAQLRGYLKQTIRSILNGEAAEINVAPSPPTVILVVGVNGSGKTTSIAKLAQYYRGQGKKVLLAASDTFRAAAVEQLDIWSKRIGVDIVKHQMGADPGAVAYDAVEAAVARNVEVLIVDTAGRLHTKRNLMKELNKIQRVLQKKIPDAPHEVLLVLDATTGQNALPQADLFSQAVAVTGIFLAKLDGTAKGGIVVAIRDKIDIPVKFIGIGETPDDIEPFNAERFVEALFD